MQQQARRGWSGVRLRLRRGERLVDEAFAGHGALLLMSGEAGIGKSALATAIGQRALERGAAFAVGRCYEAAGHARVRAWHDLLTELARQRLRHAPPATAIWRGPTARTAYELLQP